MLYLGIDKARGFQWVGKNLRDLFILFYYYYYYFFVQNVFLGCES